MCVFDLNNLHTVNNNFGHEKGDEYIRSFAQQLGCVASETCFVGRDGGDEFIAVLWDADRTAVESCLARVRANVNEYSEAHPDLPTAMRWAMHFPVILMNRLRCASSFPRPTKTCTSTRTA